jgi:hypothetical protein
MNSQIISKNMDIFQKRLFNLIDKEIAMFKDQLCKQLTSDAPEITQEITPEILQEIIPEILPEITQEILPEITQEIPGILQEIIPEIIPEIIQETPVPKTPKNKTEKSKCPFVLKSGKNKGDCCGKNVKDPEEFCPKHTKKNTEPEPETPLTLPDQILERITIDGKTVLSDGSSIYQEIDNNFVEIGKINNDVITYY